MRTISRAAAVLVVLLVVAAGVATAETRAGGTIVVEEGETVDGLEAFGGNVIVRGTVDGDLTAFSGNVVVDGEVTGDVAAFAGNVQVDGRVGGDVAAFGGNVVLGSGSQVGGNLDAAAGTITVDGAVDGNARLGAETVTLGPTAAIQGDLEYDAGNLVQASGATVAGQVTQNDDLAFTGPTVAPVGVPSIPAWVFSIYWLLVNFVVGAVLLLALPSFSRSVADRVSERPLVSGGVGLLALVGVPVVLAVVAITIVGIPLAILGGFLFALLAWLGAVYGSFAVGSWLLSLADVANRWAALALGLVAVVLVSFVPWVGDLVAFVVFLLGLGALALAIDDALGRPGRPSSPESGDEEAGEPRPA
ncbi:polymer-forming cytoskeletal protein [Halobacteriaceae archaeon GCM10025711]